MGPPCIRAVLSARGWPIGDARAAKDGDDNKDHGASIVDDRNGLRLTI